MHVSCVCFRLYPKHSDILTPFHTCSNKSASLFNFHLSCLNIVGLVANSVDPDQMPHNPAPIQGLHCLLKLVGPNCTNA